MQFVRGFRKKLIFVGIALVCLFPGKMLLAAPSEKPLGTLPAKHLFPTDVSPFGVAQTLSLVSLAHPKKTVAAKRSLPRETRIGRRVWPTKEERKYLRWKLASRGGFEAFPSLALEATAYDPGPISCGPHAKGITATGMRAGYGVAAVDPQVIPLGTRLYVEGYGYAIAADVGSAIKGRRIDLCFNTYQEAIQYGRRQLRVYILGK